MTVETETSLLWTADVLLLQLARALIALILQLSVCAVKLFTARESFEFV